MKDPVKGFTILLKMLIYRSRQLAGSGQGLKLLQADPTGRVGFAGLKPDGFGGHVPYQRKVIAEERLELDCAKKNQFLGTGLDARLLRQFAGRSGGAILSGDNMPSRVFSFAGHIALGGVTAGQEDMSPAIEYPYPHDHMVFTGAQRFIPAGCAAQGMAVRIVKIPDFHFFLPFHRKRQSLQR